MERKWAHVEVAANGFCSDDPTDARCGKDGSLMGIRCPDNSACLRKCCHEEKRDEKCGGIFKLKCNQVPKVKIVFYLKLPPKNYI